MWVENHVDLQFTHRKAPLEVQEAVHVTKQGMFQKALPYIQRGLPLEQMQKGGVPSQLFQLALLTLESSSPAGTEDASKKWLARDQQAK